MPNSRHKTATGYFQAVQFVGLYMRDRALPLLRGVMSLTKREETLYGLFLRALCLMDSVSKLNRSTDFQMVVGATRTMLEILVDTILVHHDKTGESAYKMRMWELSGKLKAAEAAVAFLTRSGGKLPNKYRHLQDFIQREKSNLLALRSQIWPYPPTKTPPATPEHPERWTGRARSLLADVQAADTLHGLRLEEHYVL